MRTHLWGASRSRACRASRASPRRCSRMQITSAANVRTSCRHSSHDTVHNGSPTTRARQIPGRAPRQHACGRVQAVLYPWAPMESTHVTGPKRTKSSAERCSDNAIVIICGWNAVPAGSSAEARIALTAAAIVSHFLRPHPPRPPPPLELSPRPDDRSGVDSSTNIIVLLCQHGARCCCERFNGMHCSRL